MRKKIVYIGIGLLILSIVLFIVAGFLLSSGLGSSIMATNLTVQAGGFSSVPITYYSNTSALAVYAVINNPANLYLMNHSSFTSWSGYMDSSRNASGIKYAEQLGINSTHIFPNTSFSVIPINLKGSATSNLSANRIYVVIDNTLGSKSSTMALNASVSYLPLESSRLIISAVLGYGVIILAIAAIVLIIWGLVKKDKLASPMVDGKNVPKDQQEKEYVDQLYKGVKGKRKRSGNS